MRTWGHKATSRDEMHDNDTNARTGRRKAQAIDTFRKKLKSTSLKGDKGMLRLLEVFDLRPEGDGNRVDRPRSILRQCILGLHQLGFYRGLIRLKVRPSPTLSDLLRGPLQLPLNHWNQLLVLRP